MKRTFGVDLFTPNLEFISRSIVMNGDWLLGLGAVLLLITSLQAEAQGRPFTVADDIGTAHFGDTNYGQAKSVQVSPNGAFVGIYIERGDVAHDRVEGTLRVYRQSDLGHETSPQPIWQLIRATSREGVIMKDWRWLPDSSGITYLERQTDGLHRLTMATFRGRSLVPLSSPGQDVITYDVRDERHLAYVIVDPKPAIEAHPGSKQAVVVGTGQGLIDLLFRSHEYRAPGIMNDRGVLWAATGSAPHPVYDMATQRPVLLYYQGEHDFALAPDGRTLLTAVPVHEVPKSWQRLYPPPDRASPFALRAGTQEVNGLGGLNLTSVYATVDLRSGSVMPITSAPTSWSVGWWAGPSSPIWSSDGKFAAIPGTFVAASAPSKPCLAIFRLSSRRTSCLSVLKGSEATGFRMGFSSIESISFRPGRADELLVEYRGRPKRYEYYTPAPNDLWSPSIALDSNSVEIGLSIKQDVNNPPLLVFTESKCHAPRIVWDPNPQLHSVRLSKVVLYKWTDKLGNSSTGGLYLPDGYMKTKRYSVVLQTHGFFYGAFNSSGNYPTSFAARELAAAGFMVLQMPECPIEGTPREPTCNAAEFEAAFQSLSRRQDVDSKRIGIIGFSRTVYHVLATLTRSRVHFSAALIADGVMENYMQYMLNVDELGNDTAKEASAIIGEKPFGKGLKTWLARSPLFKFYRLNTPLMVVANGKASLLDMWEPYAALRYLKKPVDLIMLNTDEHVLTNPSARMASQGESVDWFRFWLQGYEDRDPTKREQYARWEKLCGLDRVQNPGRHVFCVSSRIH